MSHYLTRDRLAVLAGLAAPLALAAILVPFRASFPNTDAALALLLVVVAVAANGYRVAGFFAAVSVAVWFDFFLTQPYERFTITRRTDIETTVLLLVIGVAVTEIAVWGRGQRVAASRRAGFLDGINGAARAVATGSSASVLIGQVTGQLTELLSLGSCSFQYGVAGIGRPARLHHDGSLPSGSGHWTLARRASRPVPT
jgi:K+-sensing histidine kinase KdpD